LPVWLNRLWQDWRILAHDPVSVVMGILIAIGISIGLIYWSYTSLVAWWADQVRLTASELADLQTNYNQLKTPPRDENGVYLDGKLIGLTTGAEIDQTTQSVAFEKVSVKGKLDRDTLVEFRDLILDYRGCDMSDGTSRGEETSYTYYNARFSIVGKRKKADSES
jgi:hypothetical protein